MGQVAVIIPTYNERENLPMIIERIKKTLRSDFEIIIIDDSSPDGTGELVKDLSAKMRNLMLISRKSKAGLSSAVTTGFQYADSQILAVMDADLQHPPEKLREMLFEIQKGADIAIGSRHVSGGTISNWNLRRRIISKIASAIAHIFLPNTKNILDPMSGFFMLRRDVIRNIQLNPIGFKILLEILSKGCYRKVVEIPYTFVERKRGKTKFNIFQAINYLKQIVFLVSQK